MKKPFAIRRTLLGAIILLAVSVCQHNNKAIAQTLGNSLIINELPQYAVFFSDKQGTPYSVERPLEFLSQRALDRRILRGIPVNEDDLPVNPGYVDEITAVGAKVKWTSRWFNFAMVYADSTIVDIIEAKDFVDSVVYIRPADDIVALHEHHDKWRDEIMHAGWKNETNDSVYHGDTFEQINQINGVEVHKQGYTGKGVLIAVLDAGFKRANALHVFDSLYENDKIVYTADIVDVTNDIYDNSLSNHGTAVLSTMGGNIPYSYIGTAPDASYALIRTEDAPTEYLIEEYNWVIGAEKADSIGADIINSSLGYSTFDDPAMEIPYNMMDGFTAISSKAVAKLVERGVFVVVSAGNSNGTDWPWVGTPADAPAALTVGAVTLSGNIASFSSIGPNGAGLLKPNTVACGVKCAAYIDNFGSYLTSGTSFSSPITCGMTACMIQAKPDMKPSDLLNTIEKNSDRYENPDYYFGNGLPDFNAVLSELTDEGITEHVTKPNPAIYPNPTFNYHVTLSAQQKITRIVTYDINGPTLNTRNVDGNIVNMDFGEFGRGVYIIKVYFEDGSMVTKKIVVM